MQNEEVVSNSTAILIGWVLLYKSTGYENYSYDILNRLPYRLVEVAPIRRLHQ